MTVDTLLSPYELIMREEGRQEGRQEGSQKAVLAVLEARFGDLPEDIKNRILEFKDETALEELTKAAATASTFSEFLSNPRFN